MERKLHALADPTRRTILQRTWNREIAAGQLAEGFLMTRPAVSQHLRVLREAGLLTVRREGTRRLYSAHPAGLEEIVAFFDGLWDRRLAALKAAVEAEAGTSGSGRGAGR